MLPSPFTAPPRSASTADPIWVLARIAAGEVYRGPDFEYYARGASEPITETVEAMAGEPGDDGALVVLRPDGTVGLTDRGRAWRRLLGGPWRAAPAETLHAYRAMGYTVAETATALGTTAEHVARLYADLDTPRGSA